MRMCWHEGLAREADRTDFFVFDLFPILKVRAQHVAPGQGRNRHSPYWRIAYCAAMYHSVYLCIILHTAPSSKITLSTAVIPGTARTMMEIMQLWTQRRKLKKKLLYCAVLYYTVLYYTVLCCLCQSVRCVGCHMFCHRVILKIFWIIEEVLEEHSVINEITL